MNQDKKQEKKENTENNINPENNINSENQSNDKSKNPRPRLFSRDVNDITRAMLSSSPR